MRLHIHPKTAVPRLQATPFAGLGFAMDDVEVVAQTMTPVRAVLATVRQVIPATVRDVTQPSGYSLLVALGREIRGR